MTALTSDPRMPANLTAPLPTDPRRLRAMLEARIGQSELLALVQHDDDVRAKCGTDAADDAIWFRLAGYLERTLEHSLRKHTQKYVPFAPLDQRHVGMRVCVAVGVSPTTGLACVLAARDDRAHMQMFVRHVHDLEHCKWRKHRGFGKLRARVVACDVVGRWATLVLAGGQAVVTVDLEDLGAKPLTLSAADPVVHAASNGKYVVAACANGAAAVYRLDTLAYEKRVLAYHAPAVPLPSPGLHPLTGEPLEPAEAAPTTLRVMHAHRVAFNQLEPSAPEVVFSTKEGNLVRVQCEQLATDDCVAMCAPPSLDETAPTRAPPLEFGDAVVYRHASGADDWVLAQGRRHLSYRCLGPLEEQIAASGIAPRYPTMWVPDAGGVLSVAVHCTTLVVHKRDNSVYIGSLVPNPVEPTGNPFRVAIQHPDSVVLGDDMPVYGSLYVDMRHVCCLLPDGTVMVSAPGGV